MFQVFSLRSDAAHLRTELNIEIRCQVPADGTHPRNADKPRGGVFLPLRATVDKRTNASFPRSYDSILRPRLHIALKTLISHSEILGSVVEARALGGPTRCHPPSNPSTLLENGDLDTMVEKRASANEAGYTGTDNGRTGPGLVQRARRVLAVTVWIESFRVFGCRTIPHGAENRASRLKGPIKLPQAPENSPVRRWVPTIECITVIQVDQQRQRGLSVRRPVEQGFPPRHPHVVVEFTVNQKRALRGIPERVTRLSPDERLPGVNHRTGIRPMLRQCLASPVHESRQALMISAIETE